MSYSYWKLSKHPKSHKQFDWKSVKLQINISKPVRYFDIPRTYLIESPQSWFCTDRTFEWVKLIFNQTRRRRKQFNIKIWLGLHNLMKCGINKDKLLKKDCSTNEFLFKTGGVILLYILLVHSLHYAQKYHSNVPLWHRHPSKIIVL